MLCVVECTPCNVTLSSWMHYQCGFVWPPILKLREKVGNKSISTRNRKLSRFNKKFRVSIIRERKRFLLHDFDRLLLYQNILVCAEEPSYLCYLCGVKEWLAFYSPCNHHHFIYASLSLFMIKNNQVETWLIK